MYKLISKYDKGNELKNPININPLPEKPVNNNPLPKKKKGLLIRPDFKNERPVPGLLTSPRIIDVNNLPDKRETFAENSRAWKHADGGEIKLISKHLNGTSNGGIKLDNTRVVKQQEEDAELERILTTLLNSPKEQGLSAADPLLTPIIEGLILGKPLLWLGKGLKTVGKSLLSNSSKKKLVRRTLSDAEKAGIPKGERNSPSPYVRKGTVDEITDDFMSVTSPDVGQLIAKKSEHAVFNHATDPTKVVKVYSIPEDGFSKISDIREFHKHYMKRNQIPYTVKTRFNGYLERNGRKYPIYVLDKVTPVPIKGNNYYEQYILPQIQQQLEKKGYKAVGSDTYSNGKFSITDLFEENIARTLNGDFVFFDPKVFGLGGVLVR